MKKIASISMVVILTAIILIYTQVKSFVPAQTQGEETPQDIWNNTGEENGTGNAENQVDFQASAGEEQRNAEKVEGEEDTSSLTEEERKVLLAYEKFLQKNYEEVSQFADRMKFDLLYIDGDDIPELALILSESSTIAIYVYDDGAVELAGHVDGQCRFKPYANLIFGEPTYKNEESEWSAFYRLLQAHVVKQQSFLHNPEYQDGEIYLLDYRSVSGEEYKEAWERWNVEELNVWGYDDAVFVKDFDDLYGEMCRRHCEALSRGGAEQHSTDVTIGWRRQYLKFSEDADVALPDDLEESDGLIIEINSCAPDLSFLEDMNRLTELYVAFGPEADLSYLGCLTGLKRLTLYSWYGDIVDISFLKELDQLTEIYTDRLCDIEDLSYFQHMVHLKSLNLSYVKDVDLNYLADLTDLEELEITGGHIRNPEGLTGLTQLETLYLCENHHFYNEDKPVFDLSPLENLSELEWMSLLNISIDDISPLSGLRNLDYICLAIPA